MKISSRLIREAMHEKGLLLASVCFGTLAGFSAIFQAYLLSKVINQVFLGGKTLVAVVELIGAILLVIAIRATLAWAEGRCSGLAAGKIKQDLRQRLLTHIQVLGPSYLKGRDGSAEIRTGELVNLAAEGIDQLEVYFSQFLPQIALAILIPVSILIFVFPTDALSGVVMLVTAPLIPIFMYLIGNTAQAITRKQWLGLSRMSAYFLDIFQGLATLKALGRSRDQVSVVQNVSEQYRKTTMGVLKVTFLSALVLELVATLSTAVIAVEIGIRLLYGGLAFEQAFFILLVAPEFYLPLRLLSTRFHASMAGSEAAQGIYGILDLPTAEKSPHQHQTSSPLLVKDAIPPSITFEDVSFTYSEAHPALQHISIEIPPGKITALTGPSGAGKTTLAWLLLRFLHPHAGEILVGGGPVSDISITDWYDQLSWVSQNPYLFYDTVAANIQLANPGADQAAIQQAVKLAHADEFIRDLPEGYETVIGERGIRLSAGQAQRIALARAFLKDAPLLVLDEATSHLDPATDIQLQDSIRQLAHKRTVVIIAHHQSTLRAADQVIELSHGRIIKSEMRDLRMGADNCAPELPVMPHENRSQSSLTESLRGTSPIEAIPQPKEHIVTRLFGLLSPFWGQIALSVALGCATILSGVGLMATAAYLICAAALHPSIADLQVAIVGVRFFGLSRGVFRYLERLVSHDVTFKLLASWRVRFYQALEPLAPARLMRYHSGDLLARVMRNIATLENFYVRTLNPPLVAVLVSSAVLLFLASFGSSLALGLLVIFVLSAVVLPFFSLRTSRRLGPEIVRAASQLHTLLIDSIQGLPDLLTCGQATRQLERVSQAGGQLNQLQLRMGNMSAWQNASMTFLTHLGMLVVLVLAIPRVSVGELNGVLLGVVALIALTGFEAIQPLPQVAQYYSSNWSAAERLYELVDARPDVIDPEVPVKKIDDTSLEVDKLSFQYPQAMDINLLTLPPTFGLQDITFSLPHGKHIAIIGPSGAGKTTLVNLLLRFWEYQHGSIQLGNHELREYTQDELRKNLAVISQNAYLFSASIRENLLISKPQATEDEIILATKHARLHDFILGLPTGYDTWIGEHGLRLSAGENQRLAIARAFLKNAPILILDEPTANLDPQTEQEILESIGKLSTGRSTITITQHMVGLENMDEILVLQNGCIVERGKHEELIALGGYYRWMWDLYHQII